MARRVADRRGDKQKDGALSEAAWRDTERKRGSKSHAIIAEGTLKMHPRKLDLNHYYD